MNQTMIEKVQAEHAIGQSAEYWDAGGGYIDCRVICSCGEPCWGYGMDRASALADAIREHRLHRQLVFKNADTRRALETA